MGYKAIFSDLDGTLLNNKLEISQGNKDAILEFSKRDVKFVVCTGRAVVSVERLFKQLGIATKGSYAICQNGATLYNLHTGELIFEKTFPYESYKHLIDLSIKYDANMQFYRDREFYIKSWCQYSKDYVKKIGCEYEVINDLNSFNIELTKLLYNDDPKKLNKIYDELKGNIEGTLNMYFSEPHLLEFTAPNATKGQALIEVSKIFGIDPKDTIGIGDNYNDLPMILSAGLGVVMNNAPEDVKKQGKYITKRDNNNDVMIELLENFLD